MRKEEHLTKPEQYALVYNKGRSWTSNLVVMKALPNGLAFARYGFSVSKRLGKAVIRNRIKRRLRQILHLTPLEPGWDIIFIARLPATSTDYASLEKSIADLLSRAQLIKPAKGKACQRLKAGVL
ncbi:MAG: ribonuclease P protein component [Dehalococcoidia bacterium]|nr:MAG: ribonuclease P protein component [Dehalococcoidia bacterium]